MISHYGSSPSYHKKSLHPIQKITWGKGTFQYIQSCESNGGRRSPLVVIFWSQQNFCYQNQSPTSSLEQLSTMNNNPIAFFSHKHNPTQHFPSCVQQGSYLYPGSSPAIPLILYGSDIVIKTEHKNLIQHNLISNYLLHWCLLDGRILFHLWTFEHLSSFTNIVTYQLSHLILSVPEK